MLLVRVKWHTKKEYKKRRQQETFVLSFYQRVAQLSYTKKKKKEVKKHEKKIEEK
jgi:hypothetical protein